jgi:hypothetical protein
MERTHYYVSHQNAENTQLILAFFSTSREIQINIKD